MADSKESRERKGEGKTAQRRDREIEAEREDEAATVERRGDQGSEEGEPASDEDA